MLTELYTCWDSLVSEGKRLKTLVYWALLICSSNKLEQELEFIRKIFCEIGYPLDVQSSINATITQFHKLKCCQPEKYPVYLKLLWIGETNSRFGK